MRVNAQFRSYVDVPIYHDAKEPANGTSEANIIIACTEGSIRLEIDDINAFTRKINKIKREIYNHGGTQNRVPERLLRK